MAVENGYTPVVATIATDEKGQALNINADTAAGEVGAEWTEHSRGCALCAHGSSTAACSCTCSCTCTCSGCRMWAAEDASRTSGMQFALEHSWWLRAAHAWGPKPVHNLQLVSSPSVINKHPTTHEPKYAPNPPLAP